MINSMSDAESKAHRLLHPPHPSQRTPFLSSVVSNIRRHAKDKGKAIPDSTTDVDVLNVWEYVLGGAEDSVEDICADALSRGAVNGYTRRSDSTRWFVDKDGIDLDYAEPEAT